MDNLTHTLIGVGFARALPKRFQRPELYWASLLGNNAPDVDAIVHFLPGATSFDYLIHHRGYTHTFLAAPILGLFSAFLAKTFTRTKNWSFPLVLMGIVSGLLHVGADFLNNYGVHPYSPFLNRWYYADTISIVEPLLWFSILPFILREAERSWARIGWAMLGLSMLALIWIFPSFTSGLSGSLTFLLVLSTILIYSIDSRTNRAILSSCLFFAVLGSFFFGGMQARARVYEHWLTASREAHSGHAINSAGALSPGQAEEKWMEAASSPLPGNPLCWTLWVATKTDSEFRFRSAAVSLWPSAVPATECDRFLKSTRQTAEVVHAQLPSDLGIHWNKESRLTFEDWNNFQLKSPTFRRMLSFARFPFLKKLPDGSAITGDLRYDRQEGIGFAEVAIPANEPPSDEKGLWEPPLLRNE